MRSIRNFSVVFLILLLMALSPVFAKGKPTRPPVVVEPIPTLIVYPTWIPETPVLTPLPILGQ